MHKNVFFSGQRLLNQKHRFIINDNVNKYHNNKVEERDNEKCEKVA